MLCERILTRCDRSFHLSFGSICGLTTDPGSTKHVRGRNACRTRCAFRALSLDRSSTFGAEEILRAKKLTFEDATREVQNLVESMSLHRCFKRRQWRDFRFFALVEPVSDVFPVRTMHSCFTQSVGNDYLTDKKPIWMAGPDVIDSVLQTDKAPRIVRAIRLVPHGKQKGLKPVRLRSAVR